jgi:predicted  nucleic acid-binding Zn-ribbon protein
MVEQKINNIITERDKLLHDLANFKSLTEENEKLNIKIANLRKENDNLKDEVKSCKEKISTQQEAIISHKDKISLLESEFRKNWYESEGLVKAVYIITGLILVILFLYAIYIYYIII